MRVQLTVDDAKQVTFFRHRREEINVFKMNDAINDLKAELAAVKTKLTTTEALVTKTKNDVDTKVAGDIRKLQEATTAGIKVATDAADSAKSDVVAAVKKLTTDVAGSIKSAATATDGKLALAKKVSDAAAATTKTQLAAVAKQSLEPPPVHMWSGSPKSHARGSGWSDFTLDRVDFDMSAPYFKRLSNTRFQALQNGYFHFSLDSMAYSANRAQKHFQFYVNGRHINGNTHFTTYYWCVAPQSNLMPCHARMAYTNISGRANIKRERERERPNLTACGVVLCVTFTQPRA